MRILAGFGNSLYHHKVETIVIITYSLCIIFYCNLNFFVSRIHFCHLCVNHSLISLPQLVYETLAARKSFCFPMKRRILKSLCLCVCFIALIQFMCTTTTIHLQKKKTFLFMRDYCLMFPFVS